MRLHLWYNCRNMLRNPHGTATTVEKALPKPAAFMKTTVIHHI